MDSPNDMMTDEDFQKVKEHSLPVLALATYSYTLEQEERAMVCVWVELDRSRPELAPLAGCMDRAMSEDEAFEMVHFVVTDFPDPIRLQDQVAVYWDITFQQDNKTLAHFSFPFRLPHDAMQIAAIIEEGVVMVCPISRGSALAQQVTLLQEKARQEGLARGLPDPGFPLAAHIHFQPSQDDTIFLVEGFQMPVSEPEALEACIELYYDLAGASSLVTLGLDADSTGQNWDDILRNGDIHFSQAR